jgi:hypothetical protein
MANGWFLKHAPRPLVEAPSETAAQVALSCWSCRGVVETA